MLRIDELKNSLGISASFQTLGDLSTLHDNDYDMGVLYCEDTTYNTIIDNLSGLSEKGNLPFRRFVLVSEYPLTTDLSKSWQLGMYCHVSIANDIENVSHSIESFCRLTNDSAVLRQQLKEASDIAILSMSASSQLGEIIRFLEKSYRCISYEELGSLLNETLARMGVIGCGIININKSAVYFGEADKKPVWERILKEFRNKGRIVDIGNRTITNFESISVMARNLPEPGSDDHGRLKDALFTLIEGAEARIRSIAIEHKSMLSEKAKNTFLSLMSHELKTPLNAVQGFSNLLKRKSEGNALTSRDIDALNMISDNANHLHQIIQNILDLSRIDTSMDSNKAVVVFRDVLFELLTESQRLADKKGLLFQVDQPDACLSGWLDQKRFLQVVKQLLSNALKFTEKGLVKIQISEIFDKTGERFVEIKVIDTGPGFTDSQRQEAFSPFTVGEDYLTRKQGGIGIGLSLATEFVTEMLGSITLESELNVGSTFSITIPLEEPPKNEMESNEDVELF